MTSGPPSGTLVIDENLSHRLATELSYRGRDAVSVKSLGLRGSSDPELLDKLHGQLDDWVLVTADDALPDSHADAVARVGATIATINPEREEGWHLEAWRREVVHRCAHVMHGQEPGGIRRYSLRHAVASLPGGRPPGGAKWERERARAAASTLGGPATTGCGRSDGTTRRQPGPGRR